MSNRRVLLAIPLLAAVVSFSNIPETKAVRRTVRRQSPGFVTRTYRIFTAISTPMPTPNISTPTPTMPQPTVTPVSPTSVPTIIVEESPKKEAAVKVEGSQYGYTMDVKDDDVMATASEIFDALNRYRASKGVGSLSWNDALSGFAKQRSDYFASNGLDEHRGFLDYVNNPDNRKSLGFWALGENASKDYKLNGTHLIETAFAGDAPHDNNQLNNGWSDVGIGVSGTSVDLIFGGSRM